MEARFVFAVEFRLDPAGSVSIDPGIFETRLYRPADPPGERGWLFFRDNLWRGTLADPEHFRDLVADALSVRVTSVEYRALETDEAYLETLRSEIGENLEEFNDRSVRAVLKKYLGSSIEIV